MAGVFPKQPTVWDECLNRNRCRFGLRDVCVRIRSSGEEDVVSSCHWGADGHLVVVTAGGLKARADDCELTSIWPISCCTPRVRHKLNAIRSSVRREIIARDGAACAICGTTAELQIDHRHPVSKGGTDRESNLRVLCRACNLKKSNRLEE